MWWGHLTLCHKIWSFFLEWKVALNFVFSMASIFWRRKLRSREGKWPPQPGEQIVRIIMVLVRADLDQAQTLCLEPLKALCGILPLPEVAAVSPFHGSGDQSPTVCESPGRCHSRSLGFRRALGTTDEKAKFSSPAFKPDCHLPTITSWTVYI